MEQVEVTDSDRETYLAVFGKIAEHEEYHVRNGDYDLDAGMQAIARHRIEAARVSDSVLEAVQFIRDTLQAVTGLAVAPSVPLKQQINAAHRKLDALESEPCGGPDTLRLIAQRAQCATSDDAQDALNWIYHTASKEATRTNDQAKDEEIAELVEALETLVGETLGGDLSREDENAVTPRGSYSTWISWSDRWAARDLIAKHKDKPRA